MRAVDEINGATPIVSVITVNLNMAAALAVSIASVAGQKFPAKEYIVIDGGSTDGSVDVINRYSHYIEQSVSEPDDGIYDAMNKGTALARGEWVTFLNSGDSFLSNDVMSRVFSSARPDADILVGDWVVHYPDGDERTARAFPLEDIPFGMICSHQAMFVRRELLQAAPFARHLRGDYEFVLKAWQDGRRFVHLGFPVALVSAGGWSDRARVRAATERWTLLRKAGLLTPKLALNVIGVIAQAMLTAGLKQILPSGAVVWLRRTKLMLFGAKSTRA